MFTRVQKFSHVRESSRRGRGIRADYQRKEDLMVKSPESRGKEAERAEIVSCFISRPSSNACLESLFALFLNLKCCRFLPEVNSFPQITVN